MKFSTNAVPEIIFDPGGSKELVHAVRCYDGVDEVLIVMDGHLARSGLGEELVASLDQKGINADVYSDFSGEPKLAHLRAAIEMALMADMVVGVGGGSALDIAKIAACCAVTGRDPMEHAGALGELLPPFPLPTILIPTTAGTGSETSSTSIFAGPDGKKLWIWGESSKANLVILDPELTISLPPSLTAWCGMDALIHAFEACTNQRATTSGNSGTMIFGHRALQLVAGSLETAVRSPENIEARGDVLLGSCYAGIAIDNCGTAIAHNISHALAGLAPIHHGLATALAFEATLPWLVETDTPNINAAARVLGLARATDLPGFVTELMDRCGIVRALPSAFEGVRTQDLAREMRAVENKPMLNATIREATDADIDAFAAKIMSLPKTL